MHSRNKLTADNYTGGCTLAHSKSIQTPRAGERTGILSRKPHPAPYVGYQ